MPHELPSTIIGLIALIVAGLLSLVTFTIRSMMSSNEKHTKSIERIDNAHRDERKEWNKEAERRSDKTDAVIGELTRAIQDISRREH